MLNSSFQLLKGVAEYVVPVLSTSQFQEKGVLTPDEFVHACDELVFRCPSWQWDAGLPTCRKSYLPPTKQYLVTRNVPSLRRSADYAMNDAVDELVSVANCDSISEEWTATHIDRKPTNKADIVDVSTATAALSLSSNVSSTPATALIQPVQHKQLATNSNDIPDLNDFEDQDLLDYEQQHQSAPERSPMMLRAEEPEESSHNIVRTRTYDLHIVYDKYYQTPRVFLSGFDENGLPLSAESIMQDISSDYANKTVTMETHPLLNVSMVSVHPCRHAEVMKRLMDRYEQSNGKKLTVDQYMIMFLKFFASVIPTIEYDFSSSI